MKLYYGKGTCALAPHIALRESGLDFDLQEVNLRTRQYGGGEDYTKVNPKGYVPALQLDSGEVLTEVAVTLQYIAAQSPGKGLLPAEGMERWRALEWLNFIATEVHKGFGPLWNPKASDDTRSAAKENLGRKFAFLEQSLQGGPFLLGEGFSVADAYLFTVLNWTNFLGIDLSPWPAVKAYLQRVGAREGVQAALKDQGLA